MGGFSIWHVLIVLLIPFFLAGFLPLIIKPSGPNRFGPSAQPRNFPDAFLTCVRKYVDFQGRATRSEYWWFYLATVLISVVLDFVGGTRIGTGLGGLASLVLLLPSLAAGARRLHDINRSGWWLLLMFSGFGAIGLIVLLAWPSQKNDAANVF